MVDFKYKIDTSDNNLFDFFTKSMSMEISCQINTKYQPTNLPKHCRNIRTDKNLWEYILIGF
ncbi:hypothetical protein HanRHA438_Chr10g0468821 [Helianthus annuus]|uniref:Uncharacterized protein n=1 Tax=Helianthus annuus TaxID=4232 RepID=A0A9K3I075_HELAN|nr:hypothetical protein HanXRQr2_Chr10g0455781 [Helianthus annuus]KAJ0514902.1 hypothetical protein HanHA300_Chr10g0374761 [Helianthus annuus]KAJ0523227.1 hypothetical protein HanIR_Chr10g0491451 [Helianthus annuus]KAJ0531066.1 hypothetical protein HanHA89_Chr10g0396981 [Helianthus annuus]KAJ0590389.1 hypothetical protein HanIR_Chr04g0196871 [Helianthus annuus]